MQASDTKPLVTVPNADREEFERQEQAKIDRKARVQRSVLAWNAFLSVCRENRCSIQPMMVAGQQGNVFQFQIIAND